MVSFVQFLFVFSSYNFCGAVKYALVKTNHETIQMDKDRITSQEGVKRLIIQEEFRVFKHNLLRITHNTPIFVMDKNHKLKKIESGAFKDQQISDTILISNSGVKKIHEKTFVNLDIFELVLSRNEITHVEKNAIIDLPNLKVLNLANNKIVEFHASSVISSPATYVDLAFNRLKRVGRKWFSFMSGEELSTVLLDHNEIGTVEESAFEDAVLGTLNLRSNNLKHVPGEVFQTNTLRRVFLQNNKLETLPETFFELSHLRFADFTGNSLDCDTQRKLQKKKTTSVVIFYAHDC